MSWISNILGVPWDDPSNLPENQPTFDGHLLKPRLAAVRSAPSREAFDAWREHPVTLFVFGACRAQAEYCEANWKDGSWNSGEADQDSLNELKARADTYRALEDSDYEAFCEALGLEPEE